jgi:drug/metabolite transporter (DMT)-like permease
VAPVRGEDILRLTALAAIWGGSFIFLRVLAPVLGPVVTATSRVLIAGIALIIWFRLTGFDADVRGQRRHFLVIGVVNSAIPFLLFSFAALHLPASYSVILNSATPLFAALLSAIFLAEHLTPVKIAGLLAGAAGVVLVSKAGPVVPDAMFGLSIAACLGAAFCYAASSIYMKKYAAGAKPMAIAGWSQVAAGVVLLPLLPFAPVRAAITPAVVANVLGLALLCSAIAYLLYYRLIADIGPTRALTVAFLMPLFGMAWGALLLDETITWPMIVGCALIVGGTFAVVRPSHGTTAQRHPPHK